jgi:hypothetical protein
MEQLQGYAEPVGNFFEHAADRGGFLDKGSKYLGGLSQLLGLREMWDRRGLNKAQMNAMNQQLSRSNAAQDFALAQAQKAASGQEASTAAAQERFAQKQNFQVAVSGPQDAPFKPGTLGFRGPDGKFSISRQGIAPMKLNCGGLAMMGGGHVSPKPSRPVAGKGTGQSDSIPALLSDGEYVIDASTVSDLGDGSTQAGAKVLDGLVKKVRTHKRGGLSQLPPPAKNPTHYLKKGA